ncbi:MAG: gfo/Idh/MocA family oxidoreductase, partial [Planctomycetota bacterium]|nr:gfo/Idh/MocA family oxidoreductase [Planctomycetota bacterium]
MSNEPTNDVTRRRFVQTSAAGAMLAASPLALGRSAHAQGQEVVRCGVVGCGGRGTGAAVNAMQANPSTHIVAMADLFPDRLQSSLGHLRQQEDHSSQVVLAEEDTYTGIDAYK